MVDSKKKMVDLKRIKTQIDLMNGFVEVTRVPSFTSLCPLNSRNSIDAVAAG